MPGIAKWIAPPMLVGILLGAALQGRAAHACECAEDYWTVDRIEVQSTDPMIDESHLWPREGILHSRRLSLWQEGSTLNLEYER